MSERATKALLDAHSALTALVSTRIYARRRPQSDPLPAVVYFRVSTTRPSAMGSDPGIARARVQVSSFGSTYDSAKTVAEAVRGAMQRKKGSYGSVTVLDVFVLNELDVLPEEETVYQVAQDYEVVFRE